MTNQKLIYGLRYLVLWTSNRNAIASHLSARKYDFAIPLLLKLFEFAHPRDQFTVVQSIDMDGLLDVICIL
jgi:hypothetical protein